MFDIICVEEDGATDAQLAQKAGADPVADGAGAAVEAGGNLRGGH
jgi:hypothetical protein